MKTYSLSNPLERDVAPITDIARIQQALKDDKFYTGSVDGIFGAGTAHAAKVAKWHYGYPAKYCLPSAGQKLYDFLTGHRRLPLAFRIRRHARGYGIRQTATTREKIVAYAMWGVAHEPAIHYAEIRPMPVRAPFALPMTTDCSGFATICYKVAGAPDPNGLGFSGYGYTGTMLDHGVTVPLFLAKPGDLVIWGAAPGHHVAIIVGTSNHVDPMIVSHGSESGPLYIRLSAESEAQKRPFVVRRYLKD